MEDYVYVLDFLAKGRGDLPPHKRLPVVYGIGENQFTLLELVPKKDASFGIGERIYVGKDPDKRNKISKIKAHTARIPDVQFSPDNKLLASASYDGTIKIWNANSLSSRPVEISRSSICGRQRPGLCRGNG